MARRTPLDVAREVRERKKDARAEGLAAARRQREAALRSLEAARQKEVTAAEERAGVAQLETARLEAGGARAADLLAAQSYAVGATERATALAAVTRQAHGGHDDAVRHEVAARRELAQALGDAQAVERLRARQRAAAARRQEVATEDDAADIAASRLPRGGRR